MTTRTRYLVRYNGECARFSHWKHAIDFAHRASLSAKRWAEVSDKSGMLAQFAYGELTPEFAHLAKEFGYKVAV